MTMTRKEFLRAGTAGTVTLLLQACGGGGGDYTAPPATPASDAAPPSGTPSAPSSCGADGAAISGNHGHVLVIAHADLDSPTDRTYSIVGAASHDHTVTFSPAQLQMLKAGQSVTVTSSTTLQHNHNVTASCL